MDRIQYTGGTFWCYWPPITWTFNLGPFFPLGKKILLLLGCMTVQDIIRNANAHVCRYLGKTDWKTFRFIRPQWVVHNSFGLSMIESLNLYSCGHLWVWCFLEHNKQDIIRFCSQMDSSSECCSFGIGKHNWHESFCLKEISQDWGKAFIFASSVIKFR